MSDRNKRNLLITWKAESEAELARVKKRLEPLEARKSELDNKIRALITLIEMEPETNDTEVLKKGYSLADRIYSLLKASSEPLHYRQIYELLVQQGIEISGKDPLKNIRAHLSRDTRFEATGGGIYKLQQTEESNQASENNAPFTEEETWGDNKDTANDMDKDMDYDPFAEDHQVGGGEKEIYNADMDYDPFAEE